MKGKRGVVFTIMAIVIAAIIVAGVAVISPAQVEEESAELFRVGVVSNVVLSFEEYTRTALRTATRSSIDEVTTFLANEDGDTSAYSDHELTIFFDDHDEFEDAVATCFVGGAKSEIELAGVNPGNAVPCNLQNYSSLLREFQDLVNKTYNVEITGFESIDETTFHISQELPFQLRANVTLPEITVRDPSSNAEWVLSEKTISTTVPIIGLKDPLVEKVAQSASADSNFNRTIQSFSISGSLPFGYEEVISVLNDELYFRWSKAPTFLERFYLHTFTPPSDQGIASFVDGGYLDNIPEVWTESLANGPPGTESNYSHVDFDILYGGDSSFTPTLYSCDGSGIQVRALVNNTVDTKDFFWLDVTSLVLFGVPGGNWTGC